jgi:hypothetical protein
MHSGGLNEVLKGILVYTLLAPEQGCQMVFNFHTKIPILE